MRADSVRLKFGDFTESLLNGKVAAKYGIFFDRQSELTHFLITYLNGRLRIYHFI